MNSDNLNYRIGILGPFGWGNLGDAAIQDAVLHNVRNRWPDAEIFGFSLNPDDTEKRHGIQSFPLYRTFEVYKQQLAEEAQNSGGDSAAETKSNPAPRSFKEIIKTNPMTKPFFYVLRAIVTPLREGLYELRFLRKSYGILKGFDLLMMSGGGQIDDFWGGAWRQPYTLFKFSLLARMAGAGPVYLSVGVGSMQSWMSKFLFKMGLRLSVYRSFRDELSREKMEAIGLHGNNRVYPDLAFSLDLYQYPLTKPEADGKLIGINPVAAYDPRSWPEKDQRKYDRYIDELAKTCVGLVRKGYRLSIFPSEIHMDLPIIDDLLAAMARLGVPADNEKVTSYPVKTVGELLHRMSECSYIVASRFHGVLLALKMAKPVVALSYHFKVDTLMEMQGQSKYCTHIDDFTHKTLDEIVERLVSNEKTFVSEVRQKSSEYEKLLEEQYVEAFTAGGLSFPVQQAVTV